MSDASEVKLDSDEMHEVIQRLINTAAKEEIKNHLDHLPDLSEVSGEMAEQIRQGHQRFIKMDGVFTKLVRGTINALSAAVDIVVDTDQAIADAIASGIRDVNDPLRKENGPTDIQTSDTAGSRFEQPGTQTCHEAPPAAPQAPARPGNKVSYP